MPPDACHLFSTLERKTLWHLLNLIFLINISELSFGYVVWSRNLCFSFGLGSITPQQHFNHWWKFLATTVDFRCFWKDHLEFLVPASLSVRCQALLKVWVNVLHPWGQNWDHPPFQKTQRKGAVSSGFSNTQGSCIQAMFVQCSMIHGLRRKLNKVIKLPRNISKKSPCKFHSVTLWCWATCNPAVAGPGVNDSAPGWFGSTKIPENTVRFQCCQGFTNS